MGHSWCLGAICRGRWWDGLEAEPSQNHTDQQEIPVAKTMRLKKVGLGWIQQCLPGLVAQACHCSYLEVGGGWLRQEDYKFKLSLVNLTKGEGHHSSLVESSGPWEILGLSSNNTQTYRHTNTHARTHARHTASTEQQKRLGKEHIAC